MSANFTCCGISFEASPGNGFQQHLEGVLHNQFDRVKALLETNCLTFTEIGSRLDVSRERVRQVASLCGIMPGGSRRTLCSIDNHRRAMLNSNTHFARFTKALSGRDLSWKVIRSPKHGLYEKEVLVEGFTVLLRTGHALGRYVAIVPVRPRRRGWQFVAYELPDRRWLILPRRRQITSQTMFAPELRGGKVGLADCYRHDYRSYIEAWDLFKGRKSSL